MTAAARRPASPTEAEAPFPPQEEAARPPLFRPQALARLATPQALDERLQVVSGAAAIVLVACLALAGLTLAWTIWGAVRVTVTGQGLLLREGGSFVEVHAPKAGWVDEIAAVGDRLSTGALIARLRAPEERGRVGDLQTRLDQLTARRREIVARQADRTRAEIQLAELKRRGFAETQQLNAQRAQELEQLLEAREGLRLAGNSTADRVLDARERLLAAREATVRARTELGSIDTTLLALRTSQAQELEGLDREQHDLEGQLDQAKLALSLATDVGATEPGQVVMIQATRNALVSAGQPLITYETGADRLEALVYLPPEAGKQVRPGMSVRVSLANAKREEYGSLVGTVRQVSPVPQTQREIANRLGNPELARKFAGDGAPIAIAVSLDRRAEGVGYLWTSRRGEGLQLDSGTTVAGAITVRSAAPISFAIPALRRWTGL
ncbi:NHLP bacteriocin system secretion protein [Methylobacterium radiotolerans]|uniref:Type I secretion adaptor protein (HlyD family) n=1 Tax=Methylobacterium radiotolerans (strain ATCC 27329 / DSM 1819 / JCM 2831 / NBRC 15690 / NCIMB 10815 / 0-1) TaxID=426355 RepID=B1M968_METRJ|nr:NHLP bacteriocin system secretion protein [Methylobacterium radiotolerans]ACB28043.1 type I secretion adaptor protein (HlyD family) [Methylobacterium radiotolerans JCM 2831]GEN01795.1 hypothetical protein MRA01_63340 [Methylobacterium radiotolerans]